MQMSRLSTKVGRLISIAGFAVFAGFPCVGQEAAGSEPKMLATGDFVSPDAPGVHVMTFLAEFEAGASIPLHHHGGASQVLLLEGDVDVTGADGTTVSFHPGDKMDEPAGWVHSGVVTSSEPAKLIWTIVLPDGAELETLDNG
ncbi:hypothetical protein DEA8626_01969 [Defluviimonas aquaemixtae]|uniref:Cupin type-2 domain-containing protein n=1 Tax=Albidovulum aquaemixtae TaxID=1542388 RepID=A0A2R8B704_9RHOB|nr:cupin domain-containing protein [Defluviimonas aquaemixtae]SPH18431.1 hypothetical protein DEA8626_01969 [Defluviimonas aquaemixtae]